MTDTPAASTARSLGYVYAGHVFRYLYLLVLIPFYGRVLGAEEYGRLLAAMSLMTMVWMLAEYGFPTVGARATASTTDRDEIASLYGRHMACRLFTMAPALLLGLAGTWLSPVLRESPTAGLLATAVGLVSALNLGWHFQGTMRYRTSVGIELAGFAINLPLILLLVKGPQDGWKVLAILLFSGVVCTVAAHAIAWRGIGRFTGWRDGKLALVREATGLFAHKGLSMMMGTSTTYLLSLFADASQVGWYGSAERLASVGLGLMQPANQVLVGTVSRRMASKASEAGAYRLMRMAFMAMTCVGVALLAGCLLLSHWVVPMVLGTEFLPAVPMLQVLGLMFPFAAFAQVASVYVLIPLRLDRLVTAMSFVGAATTVGFALAMAPLWVGLGVAWARTAGYVVLALVLLVMLHRRRLWQRILS